MSAGVAVPCYGTSTRVAIEALIEMKYWLHFSCPLARLPTSCLNQALLESICSWRTKVTRSSNQSIQREKMLMCQGRDESNSLLLTCAVRNACILSFHLLQKGTLNSRLKKKVLQEHHKWPLLCCELHSFLHQSPLSLSSFLCGLAACAIVPHLLSTAAPFLFFSCPRPLLIWGAAADLALNGDADLAAGRTPKFPLGPEPGSWWPCSCGWNCFCLNKNYNFPSSHPHPPKKRMKEKNKKVRIQLWIEFYQQWTTNMASNIWVGDLPASKFLWLFIGLLFTFKTIK